MRTLKLFFCFFFMVSSNIQAQATDTEKEVATYLESNGSMLQYEYAYDQLLAMLGNQYPKSESTREGWTYLEENKAEAVTAMKKKLIPIYQENFEPLEIKSMTEFYQSAAGKQLLNDRSKLTTIQKEELNSFYNSDLGKKIIEKQPILTQAISTVSENWSRDLYETAVSLLKE